MRLGLLPFFKVFVGFSMGILLFSVFREQTFAYLSHLESFSLVLLLLVLLVYSQIIKWPFKLEWINSILLFVSLVLTGFLFSNANDPHNANDHLLNHSIQSAYVRGFVSDMKIGDSSLSGFMELETIIDSNGVSRPCSGILKFSANRRYFNGNVLDGSYLLLKTSAIQPLPKALNPGQFDYSSFLESKGIFHQVWLSDANTLVLNEQHEPWFFMVASLGLRNHMLGLFNKMHGSEKAIAEALVLGKKDNLDMATKEEFGKTGAMHVLAVSGLHVGIIVLFLQFILWPFIKINRWMGIFLQVLFIWLFAGVSGFSPSVMRAAIMFSILTIGRNYYRPSSPLNNIFIAAVILLIADTNNLFDVGFQLSFAAVTGIVLLYKPLSSFFTINGVWGELFNPLIQLNLVAVCATIGTLPITLFYFHQFPIYFLLSNPIAIVGATVILCGALILGIIGFLLPESALVDFITKLLETCIYLMNQGIEWVYHLKGSQLLGSVYLTLTEILIVVAFCTFLFLRILTGAKKWSWAVAVAVFCFLSLRLIIVMDQKEETQCVVFNTPKASVVGIIHSDTAVLWHREKSEFLSDYSFQLNGILGEKGVKTVIELGPINQDTTIVLGDAIWRFPFVWINERTVNLIPDSVIGNQKVDFTLITNHKDVRNDSTQGFQIADATLQGISNENIYFVRQNGAFIIK